MNKLNHYSSSLRSACCTVVFGVSMALSTHSIAQVDSQEIAQVEPAQPVLSKRQQKKLAKRLKRTVYVVEPFANMHTGPGRGYPITHVLEKNDAAVILKQRTDWLKVEAARGKVGWVNQRLLQASFSEGGEPIIFEPNATTAFENRTFEFGLLGGSLEGANSVTNYVGYHFTNNISGEISYSQSFGNFSTRKLASINLVHQMFPDWRISPFFTLGTGLIQTSPDVALDQSQDREDNTLSAGGGVVIKLSRRFLFRIQYDYHTALTTRAQNEEVEEWKAGFGVYF